MTSNDNNNTESSARGLRAGDRLGAWRVQRFLGRGGMGAVYLCERADGAFVQTAALKIVDAAALGSQLVARFRAERQILASLEHPNIAKLLDAGTTAQGLPYLVMEYVDGVPITHYCDRERLSVRARLALFRTVCSAVDAAHARLVVHRDIKPGNVLVTSEGVVTLLDFGIAKLLPTDPATGRANDPSLSTATTRADTLLLSPEYASPEQVLGHAVTTASDVYSLGALLYVLLCGHAPYRIDDVSALSLARIVCETEPPRPSDMAERTRDDVDVHAARRTTATRLRRRLRGDLDNIVMQALRKEPHRRYPSALRMAEDIANYLADRPVVARPNTLRYRTVKFVRRNTAAVALATVSAVAILALVAFATVRLTQERDRARDAARKATQTAEFLRDLFHVVGPVAGQGEAVTARALLDQGARRIDVMLTDQPAVRAEMQETIGQVYLRLGLFDNAESLLERSIKTQRALYGSDDPARAAALLTLAEAVNDNGDFTRAHGLVDEALHLCAAASGGPSLLLARALAVRGSVWESAGEYAASIADLTDAVRRFEALDAKDHPAYARALHQLALSYDHLGEFERSLALLEQSFERQRAAHGALHPLATEAQTALAVAQDRLHRYAEAEANFQEALTNATRLYGTAHPVVGDILGNLGRLYNHMGRQAESRRYYERTLATTRAVYGPRHQYVGYDLIALGKSSIKAGDSDEAERYFVEALAIYAEALPEAHPYVAAGLVTYARLLTDQGRYAQALERARRARTAAVAALSEQHWLTAQIDVVIGVIYSHTREGDPRPLLQSGFERLLAMSGVEHRVTQLALEHLLDELEHTGDQAAYAKYVQYRQAQSSAR